MSVWFCQKKVCVSSCRYGSSRGKCALADVGLFFPDGSVHQLMSVSFFQRQVCEPRASPDALKGSGNCPETYLNREGRKLAQGTFFTSRFHQQKPRPVFVCEMHFFIKVRVRFRVLQSNFTLIAFFCFVFCFCFGPVIFQMFRYTQSPRTTQPQEGMYVANGIPASVHRALGVIYSDYKNKRRNFFSYSD